MDAQHWIELAKVAVPAIAGSASLTLIARYIIKYLELRRVEKREADKLLRKLQGMPQPVKDLLLEFCEQRSHTIIGDGYSSIVRFLADEGLVKIGRGVGAYGVREPITLRDDAWVMLSDESLRAKIFDSPSPK